MNITALHFDSLESTNTEAMNQARHGAEEGLCIVADEQTAGKGRQGRCWSSEAGSAVYMSMVLRPTFDSAYVTLIPLMTAVAVHKVLLRVYMIEADIKWPNDLLVNDKKICGILSEAVETPQGLAVIVGIGINTARGKAPQGATSVEDEQEIPASRDYVASVVAEQVARFYARLQADPANIIEDWKERSTYFFGKEVRVTISDRTIEGITDGLEANGALRVRLADGSVEVVHAGDVERLRAKS